MIFLCVFPVLFLLFNVFYWTAIYWWRWNITISIPMVIFITTTFITTTFIFTTIIITTILILIIRWHNWTRIDAG